MWVCACVCVWVCVRGWDLLFLRMWMDLAAWIGGPSTSEGCHSDVETLVTLFKSQGDGV